MIRTSTSLDGIRNFPLFESLNEEELTLLGEMIEFKKISRYNPVYMPGEPSQAVFFLVKGSVKICIHSTDGREIIKSVLHPMAMFGELALVGEKQRQDYCYTMSEDVHLYSLKTQDFQRLMAKNAPLSMKILSLMGNRLRRAEKRLEALIFKDARTRIIDFLKESVRQRGRRVGYEVLLKHSLTQQDIANITGTSRQTVTSVLNDLKKSDLIHFNRRSILIRDLANLA